MTIQIWSRKGQHYFVDSTFGGLQVGQAWQKDGQWTVEVNDKFEPASDLKDAIRLFLRLYRRQDVQFSAGSSGEGPSARGFRIQNIGEPQGNVSDQRRRSQLKHWK